MAVLTACGGSAFPADPGTQATSPIEASSSTTTAPEGFVPAAADDLADHLRSEYGDAALIATLVDVVFTTKLGSPVVELHFDAPRSEVETNHDDVLDPFYDDLIVVDAFVEIWSSEGWVVGSNFQIDPTPRELPPPPAGPDEVAAWFDAAYGPESDDPLDEPWLDVALAASYALVERANGNVVLEIDGFDLAASEQDDPYGWEPIRLLIAALQAGGVGHGWADILSIEVRWPNGAGGLESLTTEPAPSRWEL
jgi:hypothetical protein